MGTPALQHRTSNGFWLGLLSVGLLCGGLGYWVGKTTPATSDPVLQALQQPMTIVEASATMDESSVSSSTVDRQQLSQTVGKLHADILVLRMLYRRLAEDAGLDLTDFSLDDVIAPPTQAPLDLSDDLSGDLGAIESQLEAINESSLALKDWYQLRFQERAFRLEGPVVMVGQISSRFGWRQNPSSGKTRLHKGVDFSGQRGEPILALADGVVSFAGAVHAYGNMVEVSHADGLTTRYAHNESNTVSVGQRVEQGQIIARLGSTGRSTGPHVHLEVHLNGEAVDPMLFIQ